MPTVLMPAEIKALVDNLGIRERTLVLLAASTGLRQSELFGLKWGDIDVHQGTMNVTPSIVYGVVGPCKTEASQKPVPVHPTVLKSSHRMERSMPLQQVRRLGFCKQTAPWPDAVLGPGHFAKIHSSGCERAGIQKCIGWHTFRHTYSTLLRTVGTEFKVMQELLRHSTLRSTLDVYTQAITPAKPAAQAAVWSLVFPNEANGTSQSPSSADVAA